MDMVTLVTDVMGADLLLLQVFRNGDHLDGLRGSGLDDLVVAAQAEGPNVRSPGDRHLRHHQLVFHMIRTGPVTDLARHRFVHAGHMQVSNQRVALKTGLAGQIPGFSVGFLLHRSGTVVTVLAEVIGQESGAKHHARGHDCGQGQDDPEHMYAG